MPILTVQAHRTTTGTLAGYETLRFEAPLPPNKRLKYFGFSLQTDATFHDWGQGIRQGYSVMPTFGMDDANGVTQQYRWFDTADEVLNGAAHALRMYFRGVAVDIPTNEIDSLVFFLTVDATANKKFADAKFVVVIE